MAGPGGQRHGDRAAWRRPSTGSGLRSPAPTSPWRTTWRPRCELAVDDIRRPRRRGPQRHQPAVERGRSHRSPSTTRRGTTTWPCRCAAPITAPVPRCPTCRAAGTLRAHDVPGRDGGKRGAPRLRGGQGRGAGPGQEPGRGMGSARGGRRVPVTAGADARPRPGLRREPRPSDPAWPGSCRSAGSATPTPTSRPSWSSSSVTAPATSRARRWSWTAGASRPCDRIARWTPAPPPGRGSISLRLYPHGGLDAPADGARTARPGACSASRRRGSTGS